MKPLNYAILLYFTKVDRACVDEVIDALRPVYGHFRSLCKPAVTEALMTAEKNSLLIEDGYSLDENGELKVYYTINDQYRKTINFYIGCRL